MVQILDESSLKTTDDIQTVEQTSRDEIHMEVVAKQVCEKLLEHYPDHLWRVGWMPGQALCVQNMAIPGNYGYTIDYSRVATSSELAKLAVNAGGELLERCGWRRGSWNGEMATTLEGSRPSDFHPIKSLRQ